MKHRSRYVIASEHARECTSDGVVRWRRIRLVVRSTTHCANRHVRHRWRDAQMDDARGVSAVPRTRDVDRTPARLAATKLRHSALPTTPATISASDEHARRYACIAVPPHPDPAL